MEDGKELPRKFLRLAESFQANHTRYVAFCENLSNHIKIYWNDRVIPLSPSLNLRKLNKNQFFLAERNVIVEYSSENFLSVKSFSFCGFSVIESVILAERNLIVEQLLSVALRNIPLRIFFLFWR